MRHLFLAAVAASLAIPSHAQQAEPPSPGEIVAAAPDKAWIAIAPTNLLMMDLAPDAKGQPRRVIIQLMPAPFSQGWIDNIRKLAAAHWWDGAAVTRVQDNYVAQWGDPTEAKPLPEGLTAVPESAYVVDAKTAADWSAARAMHVSAPVIADPYASSQALWGWPIAHGENGEIWPVHCYAMVGVGRNMSPDTGSGAELYTVIGHAPRHLDRNIALVGRVVSGIEHLSSLPRGTGPLGVYERADERVPILSIRLASDLPAAQRPRFEYLSTESESFARYADARANRRDAFFIRPAGGADICNIPVPIRPAAQK